jgi:predicted kinase
MIRDDVERVLRVQASVFEARVAAGRIRDCHGDILPEDIFVDPESGAIHVLDCIEFNDRFRYSDTVADVAFLSMDLRNRGRDDLAEVLLDAYFKASDDERHGMLLAFYECYRAYVRGKVRSFVTDQEGPTEGERRRAAEQAARYFRLAHRLARRIRPRLVVVGGLMGSGKSTLATNLARAARAPLVQSDRVRKALAGLAAETPQRVGFGEGIYSPEWTARTYETMLEEAADALADGRSVVLDATWSKAKWRAAARETAESSGALLVLVECVAPPEVMRRRLSRRRPGTRPTDGRLELLEPQRAAFEPPTADEADRYLSVETTGDPNALAARVYAEAFS